MALRASPQGRGGHSGGTGGCGTLIREIVGAAGPDLGAFTLLTLFEPSSQQEREEAPQPTALSSVACLSKASAMPSEV